MKKSNRGLDYAPLIRVPQPKIPREVVKALQLCDNILELTPELPVEAIDFCKSVETKTKSIKKWIKENDFATAPQITALQNMLTGARKWIR